MTPTPTSAPAPAPTSAPTAGEPTARRELLLTVIAFALLLVAPWVLWLAGVRASPERENRPLASAPEWDVDGVLDASSFGAFDGFVLDHVPGRQESAAALNEALFATTGESPVDDAFVDGAARWFLGEDFLGPCGGLRTADLLASIERWAADVELYLVVAPDKSAILNGGLPVRSRLGNNCQVDVEHAFATAFADNPHVVELWSSLRAARFDDAEAGPLYWTSDSHWTSRGAEYLVDAVLERIRPGLYDPAATVVDGSSVVVGDVTRRMGWERVEAAPSLRSQRSGVSTTMTVEAGAEPGRIRTFRSVARGDADLITGRTVFVGDSMGNPAVDMLTPYFEESVFVHWEELTPEVVAEFFAGADRVIFEVVQRDIVYRAETRLLTPDFDESFTRSLSAED